MKKFLAGLICFLICANAAFAIEMSNVETSVIQTDTWKEDTKYNNYKAIKRHYKMYMITVVNKNTKPILLSSDTQMQFLLADDTVVKSPSRRTTYRKSRKRDVGRYWWLGMSGAVIGGGITGITFGLGLPLGVGVMAGMYAPVDKSVRSNVNFSQDLFNTSALPIKLEPNTTYEVRVFIPKKLDVKEIELTDVSFDLKNMKTLKIKVEDL